MKCRMCKIKITKDAEYGLNIWGLIIRQLCKKCMEEIRPIKNTCSDMMQVIGLVERKLKKAL